jgi:hypothetical protein
MINVPFDGAFDSATSTPKTVRNTVLLMAMAAGLSVLSAHAIPDNQAKWMTVTASDAVVAYTPVTSENACRAAQTDPAVICLSGSDMRPVADQQVMAQAAVAVR